MLTLEGLVELYLTERIEDRKSADGKIIPGARKTKGQKEVRRTMENDTVAKLGTRVAGEITRKDIVDLVNGVIERGAKVQAGNLLRELSSAYEDITNIGVY